MIRWSNRILFGLNVALIIGVVIYISSRGLAPPSDGLEYKDLISIILTAVSVILTAVTIFVAVVAIWGYNSIREASVREAVKAAEAEAGKVATDVAQTAASREALAMFKVLEGAGQPGDQNELASALQSGDGKRDAAKRKRPPAKPKPRAGEVRRRRSGQSRGDAG